MAWMKLDDKFHSSRKVNSIPKRHRFQAVGLWAIAGSWVAGEQTDGFVPDYMIEQWGPTAITVESLVNSGLWERVRDGFAFCSWLEYNPSKAQTKAEREASAQRMKASRERKRTNNAGQSNEGANVAPQHGETLQRNTSDVLQRPDPTRPDPTPVPNGTESKARQRADYSPEFETFWATYPRKEAKRQAWKAWGKAIERATPEQITAGARRYADDPNRSDQFTKHGSTWLNADGWEDDPLPSAPVRGNTHDAWSTPKGYDPADWLRKDNEPAFDYIDAEVVQLREIGR